MRRGAAYFSNALTNMERPTAAAARENKIQNVIDSACAGIWRMVSHLIPLYATEMQITRGNNNAHHWFQIGSGVKNGV